MIEEGERVGFAVELGEVHLLEPGWAIVVVLAGDQRAGTRRRRIGALLLEPINLGLQRLHVRGELLDHGSKLRQGRFGHGVDGRKRRQRRGGVWRRRRGRVWRWCGRRGTPGS